MYISIVIYWQNYMYLKKNNLVTKFQSGFRPGDSTVNQLISISIDFGKAMDGKEIKIIFFDIGEAFDRVWHKGLLYKLKSIGIDNTVLNWFGSCLSNRRHKR